MMTDTCFWCGTNRLEAAKRFEGPHATWCVHFRESQRGGDPNDRKLMDMLKVEDSKVHVAVNRALTQVGNALKDFGLFIEVDMDGNYGIGRLSADFPIKDERVCDKLRRVISERASQDRPVTAIRLSDFEARKFAAELAELQYNYAITEAEIYAGLHTGEAKFMDLPVSVYWS